MLHVWELVCVAAQNSVGMVNEKRLYGEKILEADAQATRQR